jgi:O-antigen ligase
MDCAGDNQAGADGLPRNVPYLNVGVSETTRESATGRLLGLPWWGPVGVVVGILFLVAAQLETKWFAAVLIGSIIFTVSLSVAEKKAYYLALLVFALPIRADLNLFFQGSQIHHSTSGFVLSLVHLPMAALYVIWIVRRLLWHSPFPMSTRGLMPLAAFVCVAIISVLQGGNLLFGAFDLFTLLGSIALFVYASSELRTKRELQIVLTVLFIAVLIQGLIAVGQHLTRSSLGLGFLGAYTRLEAQTGFTPLTRVGGTIGHPNALARFFDLLLPLGIGLLLSSIRGWGRLFLGTAIAIGGLGLVLTLSRGGLIATGMGSTFILFLWIRRRVGLARAICGSMLAIMSLLTLVLWTSNLVQKRFFRDDYKAAYGRVPLMQVAVNMIRNNPFFGVGLNNYNEAAPRYDTTPQQVTSVWNAPVHNLFLYIAAQTGLFGLVCYLLFLLTVFRALWPAIRAPDPLIAWTGLGVAVGLIAFLAHVQVEFDSVVRNALFWFVTGLAVSVGRLASQAAREPARAP